VDQRHDERARTWWARVALCATLGIASVACSTTPDAKADADTTGGSDTPAGVKTTATCGHVKNEGLDYKAIVGVLSDNGAVESNQVYNIAVSSLDTGKFSDTAFRVVNTASVTTAAELRITSVSIDYAPPAGVSDGETPAFECLVDLGGGNTAPCAGHDFGVTIPVGYECSKGGDKAHLETIIKARFHKPADSKARSGILRIAYLLDDKDTKGSVVIPLSTNAGAAKIVAPGTLDLGTVGVGQSSQPKQANLSNAGDAELVITSFEFAPNDTKAWGLEIAGNKYKGGTTHKLDPPLTVAKNASAPFTITYTALDGAAHDTTLTVTSNDTSSPTVIHLTANKNVPCLKVVPYPNLNLGNVVLGSKTVKKLSLKSCGSDVVKVSTLDLTNDTGGVFGIDTGLIATLGGKPVGKDNPIELKANESVDVEVACTPASENKDKDGKSQPYLAKLSLTDNTIDPNKVVTLQCQGTSIACPTAIITLPDGEQIVPQMPINLVGSGSLAMQNHAVTKWKWTVVKQPAGAVDYKFYPLGQAVVPCKADGTCTPPSPKFETADVVFGVPTLSKTPASFKVQANVAGEYKFALTVTDDSGNQSCNVAEASVFVVPDAGIHVELVWDTPGDNDKTDTGGDAGADLDLHFTHQSAETAKVCKSPAEQCNGKPCACQPDLDGDTKPDPWFHPSFDCYWYDANPKWGSLTANDDDASLDLDDTDGWGPENLNLKTPENSTVYTVGVHYWDAHDKGDSTATVNIYILGVLQATATQLLHECDLWWVKKIDWPPSDPLPDVVGAVLTAPSAGKVTPKYGSKVSNTLNGKCKLVL
jgi:hypothetical protein